MSAWNYSKKYQDMIEVEEISTALGSKSRYGNSLGIHLIILSSSAHCRKTDFFGVESKQQMQTPKVGKYYPELIPKQLPDIKNDPLSPTGSISGLSFSFSRSQRRSVNSRSVTKLPLERS